MKVKKAKKKVETIVGVRFSNDPGKLWHYLVRQGAKIHMGMEVVIHNHRGTSAAIIVQINETTRQRLIEEQDLHELKYIRYRVVPL